MSDPFDPEAWPRSSGASSSRKDEDDQFNPFAQPGNQPPAWGDEDDDDEYDASTFGGATPQAPPTDDPFGGLGTQNDFGNLYADDDEDDDQDYNQVFGGPAPIDDDDDDYDYGAAATAASAAPVVRGGTASDYDDEFDEYDDFDDYDNDDADNDYDRYAPDDGGGNGRRILGIAAAVLVTALIGGGVWAITGNGGKDEASSPTTSAPKTSETSDTVPADEGSDETGSEQPAPDSVTIRLNDALTAWGKFAVSGDIETVRPYFVAESNQFNQFKLDANTISAQPPGGAPITVTLKDAKTFKGDDNNWTVRGAVTWARAGENTQNFNWEFRLTRQSDRQDWMIEQVRQF